MKLAILHFTCFLLLSLAVGLTDMLLETHYFEQITRGYLFYVFCAVSFFLHLAQIVTTKEDAKKNQTFRLASQAGLYLILATTFSVATSSISQYGAYEIDDNSKSQVSAVIADIDQAIAANNKTLASNQKQIDRHTADGYITLKARPIQQESERIKAENKKLMNDKRALLSDAGLTAYDIHVKPAALLGISPIVLVGILVFMKSILLNISMCQFSHIAWRKYYAVICPAVSEINKDTKDNNNLCVSDNPKTKTEDKTKNTGKKVQLSQKQVQTCVNRRIRAHNPDKLTMRQVQQWLDEDYGVGISNNAAADIARQFNARKAEQAAADSNIVEFKGGA